MKKLRTLIVLGPAGSGKSMLVNALASTMRDYGIDTLIINLDPAARVFPYEYPDIDIRKYVRTEKVMRRFGLGPNGALIASMDIAIKFADKLQRDISSAGGDFYLVDTPGQLELFVFRRAGIYLLRESILKIPGNSVGTVFLFDPSLCEDANSMLSLLLLASSVEVRLNLPMLGALTKIDLYPDKELKRIHYLLSHPRKLLELSNFERTSTPIRRINARSLVFDIWPVSSTTGEGIREFATKIEDLLGIE